MSWLAAIYQQDDTLSRLAELLTCEWGHNHTTHTAYTIREAILEEKSRNLANGVLSLLVCYRGVTGGVSGVTQEYYWGVKWLLQVRNNGVSRVLQVCLKKECYKFDTKVLLVFYRGVTGVTEKWYWGVTGVLKA